MKLATYSKLTITAVSVPLEEGEADAVPIYKKHQTKIEKQIKNDAAPLAGFRYYRLKDYNYSIHRKRLTPPQKVHNFFRNFWRWLLLIIRREWAWEWDYELDGRVCINFIFG